MKNIYIDLTHEFNKEKLRAVICSGQAVVLHRLAIMSKDGDWIIREDVESIQHILNVLSVHNAKYRFGAPLDSRWMVGGWSSHFEFMTDSFRVRTDFFTRPPRLSDNDLQRMWDKQETNDIPFINVRDLAELKKTNREKDYVVIGELARLIDNITDQFLYSRSAGDLLDLAEKHPILVAKLINKRPILSAISKGREELETRLDAEKRELMRINVNRLQAYSNAAEEWANIWTDLAKKIDGAQLLEAHEIVVNAALGVLPFTVF